MSVKNSYQVMRMAVDVPVRVTTPAPTESPIRRLAPDELCPDQKTRVTRTVRKYV